MRASELLGAGPLVLAVPADPQPPVQYSWWVWGIGLLLLVAVAAWYWWVSWSSRPRLAVEREGRSGSVNALRTAHLRAVDDAYHRYTTGESDLRALHLDLNHLVRQFASDRAGLDLSSLTTRELTRLEHGTAVRELLEDFEEPAFAAASDARAEAAAEQAREVIRTW